SRDGPAAYRRRSQAADGEYARREVGASRHQAYEARLRYRRDRNRAFRGHFQGWPRKVTHIRPPLLDHGPVDVPRLGAPDQTFDGGEARRQGRWQVDGLGFRHLPGVAAGWFGPSTRPAHILGNA